MELSQTVRVVPLDGDEASPASRSGDDPRRRPPSALGRAVVRTRQWLLDQQHAGGYWVAELEGDTILESEYILLLAYLGRHDSLQAGKAARTIIEEQLPTGGWSIYPGGGVEISASVKAYFALKLAGHEPSAEYMQRARAAIMAHGGADAVNSFTRFYLALLGQISYDQCPEVPPEIVLLPGWFPVNLYAVSAWSRTIIVPLSIMSALRPRARIAREQGIRELFLNEPADWPPLRCPGLKGGSGPLSWDRLFRVVDGWLKLCRRWGLLPARQRALAAAERWMLDRFEGSDGLGAIFPPMVWSVIALDALGYAADSPQLTWCHEQLEGLMIDEQHSLRLQPCKSPVWDTAIALRALAASGVPAAHQAIARGADWLLDVQIHSPGDWSRSVDAEPGGWCFEHANQFYPDLDDTAMAVMALAEPLGGRPGKALPPLLGLLPAGGRTVDKRADDRGARLARTHAAIAKAERWMLAMQNRDGGWGAFDRDNDREFLCHVPFADHNAMIDPSTPDLTARVLEALGELGRRVGDPAVDRGVAYLARTQEADGSWFGRWGVNYVYGTWQVLTGLAAVGLPADHPLIKSGAQWLLSHQQPEGSWGESPDSYADPRLRGQGPPTASQTAWAVLGLIAAGLERHPATAQGVEYLVDQQQEDGTWNEPEFTGTGFPLVFYLRYHMYPIYFPLLALSRFAVATAGKAGGGVQKEEGGIREAQADLLPAGN